MDESKICFMVFASFLLVSSAVAQNSVIEKTKYDVAFGNHSTIAKIRNTGNKTLHVSSYTSELPFVTSISNKKIRVNQSVNITSKITTDFRPGTYKGKIKIFFNNSSTISKKIGVEVPVHRKIEKTENRFKKNISIGTSTNFSKTVFENLGNIETRFQVEAKGNLSKYLEMNPSFTAYKGIKNVYKTNIQNPRDTDFGFYNASLVFKSLNGDIKKNVSFNTRFIDKVKPKISDTSFPDFMALTEKEFTVKCIDNLEVQNVFAEAGYTVEKVEGNNTVTVKKKLDEISFEKINNTNTWKGEIGENGRIGTYNIEGYCMDSAGNKNNFESNFSINGLNVTRVEDYRDIGVVKIGEEEKEKLFSLEKDTETSVLFKRFSENLSGYEIGLKTPNGKKFFDKVNQTIVVGKEGDYYLLINSKKEKVEEGTSINGRFGFEGVPQHVQIGDIGFSADFRNWSQPEDQEINFGNISYRFDSFAGDTPEDTGYHVEFDLYCSQVDNCEDLSEFSLGYPKKVKSDLEESYRSKVSFQRFKKSMWRYTAFGFIFVSVVLGAVLGYVWFMHETYVYMDLKPEKKNSFTDN